MQINRTQWAIGLVGVVAVGAAWYFLSGDAEPVPAESGDAASAAFVKSMDGTTPDGNITQNMFTGSAAGGLPYGELRRMFDYYLSALGEKTLEEIVRQIREELDKRLKPTQADAAKKLLDKYLDYKRELVTVEQAQQSAGQAGIKGIKQRFAAMQDLRTKFFSPQENEGMFGFEDAYDTDAIARLEIAQNDKLSAEQKRDQLAALDAAMPKALREERDAPRQVILLEQRAAEMRAKGASDQDVYNMRSKALNPEAAARLAEVDREEAAWKARINGYLAERSKLMKQLADAPAAERDAAIAKLQQSKFSPDEIPRLVAYEPQ